MFANILPATAFLAAGNGRAGPVVIALTLFLLPLAAMQFIFCS
jgi:hypothetical protein